MQIPNTLAETVTYATRSRVCDLGYLREAYYHDNQVSFRCAAEPVTAYLAKDGKLDDTLGRKCLCNALLSAVDLGQVQRFGYLEPALLTNGDDLILMNDFLGLYGTQYTARDVMGWLLDR